MALTVAVCSPAEEWLRCQQGCAGSGGARGAAGSGHRLGCASMPPPLPRGHGQGLVAAPDRAGQGTQSVSGCQRPCPSRCPHSMALGSCWQGWHCPCWAGCPHPWHRAAPALFVPGSTSGEAGPALGIQPRGGTSRVLVNQGIPRQAGCQGGQRPLSMGSAKDQGSAVCLVSLYEACPSCSSFNLCVGLSCLPGICWFPFGSSNTQSGSIREGVSMVFIALPDGSVS